MTLKSVKETDLVQPQSQKYPSYQTRRGDLDWTLYNRWLPMGA